MRSSCFGPAGAELVAVSGAAPDSSRYPRRTATGVEWTFASAHSLDGLTLDIRHTLVAD